MYRISGPIASYALKIGDKNIILFGDWHESKSKQCLTCKKNCMYVVDLLKRMKPKSDLFIESYINLGSSEPIDVLNDVIFNNFDQMFNHMGKGTNGVKVHYSDIRTLECFFPFWLSQIILWQNALTNIKGTPIEHVLNHFLRHISWCNTTQKMKQYIDIMLLSNDFIADARLIIPVESQEYFIQKKDMMFLQRKYVTRLRKQFHDLQPKYKHLLLAFHEDMCAKYHKKTKVYDKAMSNYIDKGGKISKLDKYKIFYGLLMWGVHVKDLYTLARMLYYFDKTDNIVSYDGAAHSKVYAYFFSTYMQAQLLHKESHFSELTLFNISIPFPSKLIGLRCVKLPKKVVKDVFDVPVQ
jgi:hypothetical protein